MATVIFDFKIIPTAVFNRTYYCIFLNILLYLYAVCKGKLEISNIGMNNVHLCKWVLYGIMRSGEVKANMLFELMRWMTEIFHSSKV